MSDSRDYCQGQPAALAMGCWRADGSLFSPNEGLLRLLGCTREEIDSGRVRWPDVTPKEYAPLDLDALQQIRERGECAPFQKEYIRSNGLRVPVLVGGAAFGNGVVDAGGFFAVDLTTRSTRQNSVRPEAALPTLVSTAFPSAEKIKELLSCLTPREREIAALLASGESCKQIARRLEIAPKTVDNYRTSILNNMEADNPTRLAYMLALANQ